jgi:long-chain acyl-CoA synthetase
MSACASDTGGESTVGALLERIATQRPHAPCLIDPDSGVTMRFAELHAHVAAAAMHLHQLDLSRGDRVCVVMENGAAAVVAQLAAMSSGLVPVPIDPGAVRTQLAYIARASDARMILVSGESRAEVESIAAELNVRIESIGVGAHSVEGTTSLVSLLGAGPDDDALLMYTSGSTGRPKGVLVSHTALVARVVQVVTSHELTADDRLLCVLPLYHMNAVLLMLSVLYSGGSVVMPPRFSVARYWDWVVAHRCTWLVVVPTIVAQLLRWGEAHPAPSLESLRRVRFARCSSAPLSDDAHRAFEERFGIVLVQAMGMTEAGAIFLNPPDRTRRKIGALGRSCGLAVKIVGADGRDVPDGETGELLVRGAGVMRGYFRDPAATAVAIDADGWLRTGDLVYRDADGYFFHAGRAKDLIIKAGTNIAPAEVDDALASHPAVAQAVAIGVADSNLGEDIGAFVVLREGAQCSERALLDHCEARVGEFKTPSWITFVEALPSGPSGKVLRGQLAQRAALRRGGEYDRRALSRAESSRSGVRNAIEHAIAGVWADVLGRDTPGVEDDFFALGGTSLHALRITTRLRQVLGVQLSLGALLGAPTVAAQADLVAERQQRGATAEVHVGERGSEDTRTAAAMLLAPIDAQQAGTPLFCVHDIGRFIALAEALGPRTPVYGVAIGPVIAALDSSEPTASFADLSVEALARACVAEIRRTQPLGPYQIGGFSFGGRIALEVAQQLRAAGEEVRLLVIFDTFLPGAFSRRPLRWLAEHLAGMLRDGPRYVAAAARRRHEPEVVIPAPDQSGDSAAFVRREAALRRQLGLRYRPQPYAGRVVLFRATANAVAERFRANPRLGWERIAPDSLHVHDVPGKHLEILSPQHVPPIADALRRYL